MRYIYIYIFHTICVAGVWAGYSTRHQIQRSRTPTTTTTTKKTDSVGYWGSYTKLLAAVRSIIINGGRLCVPCNMLQPRTHLQTSAHMKQARFGGPQRHGTSSLAPHLTPSSAAAAARCHLAVNAGGIWANWARVDQVHLTTSLGSCVEGSRGWMRSAFIERHTELRGSLFWRRVIDRPHESFDNCRSQASEFRWAVMGELIDWLIDCVLP